MSIFQIIFCPGGMEGMTRSTNLASACSHCPPKLLRTRWLDLDRYISGELSDRCFGCVKQSSCDPSLRGSMLVMMYGSTASTLNCFPMRTCLTSNG